jgi:hypothetical protein
VSLHWVTDNLNRTQGALHGGPPIPHHEFGGLNFAQP